MTLDILAALSAIEAALEELRQHVLMSALRPGIGADDVHSLLGECGLSATSSLETLYGWHDGTGTAGVKLGEIYMLPGYYLLSLEDAAANYRSFIRHRRWSPGWLPVFANGGGDFYVVELGTAASGTIRHFRIEESEHPVEFLSLSDMLKTLAAGFDRGVFFVDAGGYLDMDYQGFAGLAAELNPMVSWWTDPADQQT